MAEVLTDANAGRKRRLPVWMQGVHANNKQSSGNEDKKCMLSKDQSETQAAESIVKSMAMKPPRRFRGVQDGFSGREENSEKCAAKRRTKRVGRRDNDPSNSIISRDETGLPKEELRKEGGRMVHRAALKKRNHKFCRSKDSEVESISQESSGDEMELTVEDLITIAQEYVNADEKQRGPLATGKPNSRHLSSSPISSKADLRGRTETTARSQPLSRCASTNSSESSVIGSKEKEAPPNESFRSNFISRCTTTRCSSHLNEAGRDGKESPATEDFTTNVRATGDAAQDMLDLFLGPLLKKPDSKERDPGIAKIENLTLLRESDKQLTCMTGRKEIASQGRMAGWKEIASQGRMAGWKGVAQEARSMDTSKEEAPLTKKKSSLKDKVAAFLD